MQKQFTRERLIDSAIAQFEEFGFRSVTIEQIAERAGANRTTFYLHFKSKTELAAAMGERVYPDIIALLHRLDVLGTPDRPTIRRWLKDFAAVIKKRRLIVEMAQEAMASDHVLAQEGLRVIDVFCCEGMAGYLDRLAGEEREIARTRLTLLFLMLDRVFYLTVVHHAKFPANNALDVAADIVWKILYQDVVATNLPDSPAPSTTLPITPPAAKSTEVVKRTRAIRTK